MKHLMTQAAASLNRLLALLAFFFVASMVAAPAQAQTPPPGFYHGCSEGSECVIGPYSKDVWFGEGNSFYKRVGMTGMFSCSQGTFGGDPAKKRAKHCFISNQESRRQACAVGGGSCNVNPKQNLWYGADGRFHVKEVSGNVSCSDKTFGDPYKGAYKGCFYFQPW